MTEPRSLRSRLALGYAGIALLTALVLGAILAVALPPFLRMSCTARFATSTGSDGIAGWASLTGTPTGSSTSQAISMLALANKREAKSSRVQFDRLIDLILGERSQAHGQPVWNAPGITSARLRGATVSGAAAACAARDVRMLSARVGHSIRRSEAYWLPTCSVFMDARLVASSSDRV